MNYRVLIVTVDCAGKKLWLNADGNSEFPANSGKSYKNFAVMQREVAEANSLPCCDLFHTSGINSHTGCCFGAESEALDPYYTPYLLDENGNAVSDELLQDKHGESYYQIRDGKVVLKKYNEYAPYPYNRDQLHKSALGYRRIGEVITGAIISAYGI